MVCQPETPVTKAGPSEEATTPTPGSPKSLSVTTPAGHVDHPTDPTPNSPKDKGKGKSVMAPPVTPKNPTDGSLLEIMSSGQRGAFSPLTPSSVSVRHVAASPDGVVFTFSSPETRSVASPRESWENAINFRQSDEIQFATPSGSNRTVVTNLHADVRSWFTIPDSTEYDVEQQSLLDGSLASPVPQLHDYGTNSRPTHDDIHPGFWDCFSKGEMLSILALAIIAMLFFVWIVIRYITFH
ncbi:hypothetical protein GL218_01959 [Daldinia childiae]|uniref:uncharacterized protein n=1 Tax=Daldinia childiae TaxID=326645 RepID=UPI00144820B2|nr:uncharacterized protein GL218_01959 [Daldinia childiae]KAF3063942.1 hypothetical protein GL218_01959 [Daldinia childiae]